jgi:hypothetical protein
MSDRINTVDLSQIKTEVINTNIDLINPEQYREKKNQR